MPAPHLGSVPHFYHGYVLQVAADDAYSATTSHLERLISQVETLPEEEWNHAYAPGKWTVKELVQHVIDAERIFSHRALSIARKDPNPLPGFDEEEYASVANANARSSKSLLAELKALSESTKCLFSSFNEEQLDATGIANGLHISVNAIAFIVAGHALHHTHILRSRYLDKTYRHDAVPA